MSTVLCLASYKGIYGTIFEGEKVRFEDLVLSRLNQELYEPGVIPARIV